MQDTGSPGKSSRSLHFRTTKFCWADSRKSPGFAEKAETRMTEAHKEVAGNEEEQREQELRRQMQRMEKQEPK